MLDLNAAWLTKTLNEAGRDLLLVVSSADGDPAIRFGSAGRTPFQERLAGALIEKIAKLFETEGMTTAERVWNSAPGDHLTIDQAQYGQPWTVPYAQDFVDAQAKLLPHLYLTHAILHAAKSVGKLAAVVENLDHDPLMVPSQRRVCADMAADLVTAALRIANLLGFRLSTVLAERVAEKNGAEIDRTATVPEGH